MVIGTVAVVQVEFVSVIPTVGCLALTNVTPSLPRQFLQKKWKQLCRTLANARSRPLGAHLSELVKHVFLEIVGVDGALGRLDEWKVSLLE